MQPRVLDSIFITQKLKHAAVCLKGAAACFSFDKIETEGPNQPR